MKKIVLLSGICLCLAAVVLAAGCVGSDPIVGTWESSLDVLGIEVAGATAVFNADGTGTTTGNIVIFSTSTSFTWKKVADGKYSITADGATKEVAVTFSGDGKSMTFDNTKFTKKV